MVFDNYISTAIDEYNIHFDIYYRENGEFGHSKEGQFLTAFQSMTFYGTSNIYVTLAHFMALFQKSLSTLHKDL